MSVSSEAGVGKCHVGIWLFVTQVLYKSKLNCTRALLTRYTTLPGVPSCTLGLATRADRKPVSNTHLPALLRAAVMSSLDAVLPHVPGDSPPLSPAGSWGNGWPVLIEIPAVG